MIIKSLGGAADDEHEIRKDFRNFPYGTKQPKFARFRPALCCCSRRFNCSVLSLAATFNCRAKRSSAVQLLEMI